MKEKVCFSFWVDKKEAAALRKRIQDMQKVSGRRISIADIVYPAIMNFIRSGK
jgi:hypothetical protein